MKPINIPRATCLLNKENLCDLDPQRLQNNKVLVFGVGFFKLKYYSPRSFLIGKIHLKSVMISYNRGSSILFFPPVFRTQVPNSALHML